MVLGCPRNRRPADKPHTKQLSTAGQPRIVFLHRFTWDFVCSCFRWVVQDSCPRCPWGPKGSVVSCADRTVGVPSCRAPPCPAGCRAPPCLYPPVVCPGFGFDKPIESKTRTYHGRVAPGRAAGWRGGVGQDCSPTGLCTWRTFLPRTLQSIEVTSPERPPRSTNKRNPI